MMKFFKKYYFLLFAVFPVLQFYSANRRELDFDALVFPILFSIVLAFLIYLLIGLFMKDFRKRSALVILFLLYFYSFEHIRGIFPLLTKFFDRIPLTQGQALWILYTMSFIFLARIILSIKKNITVFFIILGLYLTISPLFFIIPLQIQRKITAFSPKKNIVAIDHESINKRPDVYYIILDRYAGGQILKENYNFDNSDFLSFLEKQGFYIANNSFANYPKTHLSLASTLNIEYLDELVRSVGEDNGDYSYAYEMVQDNIVAQTFKSMGYKYIYFGDWWEPTRVSPLADKNVNLYAGEDEFTRKLYKTTALYPITKGFLLSKKWIGFSDERVYENTLYKFNQLQKIALEPGPKFIFAHMLIPHYPYIFDENCYQKKDDRKGSYQKKYIVQLICTNKEMKQVVRSILEKSQEPPIIIIQSDEGPFEEHEMNKSGEGVDWTKVSDKALRIHMKILNTYYLPGFDYTKLYKGISPVNTFRLIFNYYFSSNLPLLPDRTYTIPHLNYPYKYTEITNIIKN